MRELKVYSKSVYYASWLSNRFDLTIVDKVEDADLVIFIGGADVSPSLYNNKKHPRTYCNLHTDLEDQEDYRKALANNIPMFGICRGAQFLTVMNGGKLIQDVTSHGGMHGVLIEKDIKGRSIEEVDYAITSTHHQMCYPFDLPKDEYQIIGSTIGISNHYEFEEAGVKHKLPDDFVEVEMVYYPKTNCFGVQGHPEGMNPNRFPVINFLLNQIELMLK